jgi:hypothetical protein
MIEPFLRARMGRSVFQLSASATKSAVCKSAFMQSRLFAMQAAGAIRYARKPSRSL